MYLKQLLFALFLTTSNFLFAGWVDQNTGISDDLNDVSFFSTNEGVIAGNKGIYFTTSGGFGPGSWTRFNITGSLTDAAIYDGCQFYSVAAYSTYGAYFCGKDTVNNKAVIFYFDLSALTYSFKYFGALGSKLNDIEMGLSQYYAVGDAGLIVRSDFTTCAISASGTTADLYSIERNGSAISVGGNGVFLKGTETGSYLSTILHLHPGFDLKAVWPYSTSITYSVGETAYKLSSSGTVLTSMNSYDLGPLNANDIFGLTSGYIVATDHGIFKSDPAYSYLEHQITSGTDYINKLWFSYSASTIGYAVGKNGLLLKTTDAGGATQPYATTNLTINCRGTNSNLYGSPGSATNCKWTLNSTLISSSCSAVYLFTTSGTYNLKYIVWNSSGIYDTVSQTIYIVDPPSINQPVSIVDSIICKKESVDLTIDSTQVNFIYQLKKIGSPSVYGSVLGSGALANLTSDTLTQGGLFFINVLSAYSQCSKAFTDTIKIAAEYTKADFHSSLINADVGENVNFYEKTVDAQNFLWGFSPGASVLSSALASPFGVNFSIPGSTQVKLICWSDNGCYDSVIRTGPYIYIEPTVDSCWAFATNGVDPPYMTSGWDPGILTSVIAKDGYLSAGRTYKDLFTSRYASVYGPSTTFGGCLVKYSKNGVLKWLISNKDVIGYISAAVEPVVSSVCTDKFGNIYITGNSNDEMYFYLNDGDSVKISHPDPFTTSTGSRFDGYVAKLDSLGNLIWRIVLTNAVPEHIKLDKSGNIILTGYFRGSATHYKGLVSTTVPNSISQNYFLMKLDTVGDLLWNANLDINHTNFVAVSNFDMDGSNNIYLTGAYEYSSYFQSATGSTMVSFINSSGTTGEKMFVVKYDSLGFAKWGVKGVTSYLNKNALGSDIVTDSIGNSYVVGSANIFDPSYTFDLTNSLGVVTNYNLGKYIVFKVRQDGLIAWVNGSNAQVSSSGLNRYSNICLHKNEISVSSKIISSAVLPWSGYLSSTDGMTMSSTIQRGDFFIADYDSTGVLKKLFLSGSNPVSMGDPRSLFRDESDNYYVFGTASFGPPLVYLGDSMTANGNYESFTAKMSPYGCASPLITGGNQIAEDKELDVIIYPNPVTDVFHIGLKEKVSSIINIYDVFGRLLLSKGFETDLINLHRTEFKGKSGVFMIEIIYSDKRITKKIVVN